MCKIFTSEFGSKSGVMRGFQKGITLGGRTSGSVWKVYGGVVAQAVIRWGGVESWQYSKRKSKGAFDLLIFGVWTWLWTSSLLSLDNNDIIGTDKIQALDKEMGFGYISDEKIEAKVVLQGSNPFMDNMRGDLNPDVLNYEPFSQIYNVTGIRKGSNFLILRSYT